MDDYYAGVQGARRLMNELDKFLQDLLDSVEPGERLACAIELEVKGGELLSLNKTYRPTRTSLGEGRSG